MGADQVAEIAPGIREAIGGRPDLCVTFTVTGHPDKWVQWVDGVINAAYPHVDPPESRLGGLQFDAIQHWEPKKSLTVTLAETEVYAIAKWIDSYFATVLDPGVDPLFDFSLDRL